MSLAADRTSNSRLKIRSVPSNVNPTPRPSTSDGRANKIDIRLATVEDDFQTVLSNVIGGDYIRKLLCTDDLSTIQELKLFVDSSIHSIDDLGNILPSLKTLKLDTSKLHSIRDLGISLQNIVTLSLNSCGLCELDGVSSFLSLKNLSLRDNQISDVCPLAMLENLQVISQI